MVSWSSLNDREGFFRGDLVTDSKWGSGSPISATAAGVKLVNLVTFTPFWVFFSEDIGGVLTMRSISSLIFTLAVSRGVTMNDITPELFEELDQDLREQFLHILRYSFPHSDVTPLDPKCLFQALVKNRYFAQYGTKAPLHFTSGGFLEAMVRIPEEIHKSLATYYPGEFSAPFLNDEIILGHSFNAENGHFETPGGISVREIKSNLLISGNLYEDYHTATLRLGAELVKHRIPYIYFDWDGTGTHIQGQVRRFQKAGDFRTYTAGEDFGLSIFEPPEVSVGPLMETYLEKATSIVALVLGFPDRESALLRTALTCHTVRSGGEAEVEIGNSGASMGNPYARSADELSDVLDTLYTDNSKNQKFQSPLYSFLARWQQDFLRETFSTELQASLDPKDLLKHDLSIIINLEKIGDPRYKLLFAQIFLLQWLTFQTIHEKTAPKVIMLPHVDRMFSAQDRNTIHNPLFNDIYRMGNSVVAESNRISNISPDVLGRFESHFVFRTKEFKDLRTLEHQLNFDSHYTNISTSESRKGSYQRQVLMTLEKEKCLVYRMNFAQPYIFAFELEKYFTPAELETVNQKDYGFLTPADTYTPPVGMELAGQDSQFDIDFHEYAAYRPGLILLLEQLRQFREAGEEMDAQTLRTEMQSLLASTFERLGQEHYRQVTLLQQLMERLQSRGYLETVSESLANDVQYTAYRISDLGVQILEERDLRAKLAVGESPMREDPDEILYEEAVPSDLDELLTVGNESVPEPEEVLPPEKLLPLFSPDRLTELRGRFPEIIITARSAFRRGDFGACRDILRVNCTEIAGIVGNFPREDYLRVQLDTFLKEVEHTQEEGLWGVIGRFEDFAVEI
ncbi:hypothetical protein ES708_16892 [subsurface metagenome]